MHFEISVPARENKRINPGHNGSVRSGGGAYLKNQNNIPFTESAVLINFPTEEKDISYEQTIHPRPL